MLKFVVALFLVFSCVYGQVTQDGVCDQVVNAVTGFDAEAFAGFWYTVARIPSSSGTELQCSSATYEVLSANEIHVEYRDLNNGTEQLGHFTMSLLFSVDATASFIITGDVTSDDGSTTTYTAPFWVVDTDYENYAVVASCDPSTSSRFIYGRKLSRSLNVTAEVDELMNAAIAADPYLDLSYFTDVEQSEDICLRSSAAFMGLPSLVLMFCVVLSKFI